MQDATSTPEDHGRPPRPVAEKGPAWSVVDTPRGRFGARLHGAGGPTVVCLHGFPDDASTYDGLGDALARADYRVVAVNLRGYHPSPLDGSLDLEGLRELSNDGVIARLAAVRGFGRWSAEWFLARCLGRGDVCPAGDLGVRRAFEHFYCRGRALSEESIRRRAARWRVHQNLAVHYLLAGRRLEAVLCRGDVVPLSAGTNDVDLVASDAFVPDVLILGGPQGSADSTALPAEQPDPVLRRIDVTTGADVATRENTSPGWTASVDGRDKAVEHGG